MSRVLTFLVMRHFFVRSMLAGLFEDFEDEEIEIEVEVGVRNRKSVDEIAHPHLNEVESGGEGFPIVLVEDCDEVVQGAFV